MLNVSRVREHTKSVSLIALATVMLVANAAIVAAECPSVGGAQLTWKNGVTSLPSASSDFLHLVSDGCAEANPSATTVSAKLQLRNQTSSTQTAECWLSTTKSSDYIQATIPAMGTTIVNLQIANASGGGSSANLATLMCRNFAANIDGNLVAEWIKLTTRSVASVVAIQAQ